MRLFDPQEFDRSREEDDSADRLAETIARRVENATSGRVSGLYVGRLGGSIVLHGFCHTYHERELAHQAAEETTDGSVELIDLIVVS